MRPLAGVAPWWVLVETTGRRTGRTRRTPLAAGPRDAQGMLVIAVHGRHSGWVANAEARPQVLSAIAGVGGGRREAEVTPWDPRSRPYLQPLCEVRTGGHGSRSLDRAAEVCARPVEPWPQELLLTDAVIVFTGAFSVSG